MPKYMIIYNKQNKQITLFKLAVDPFGRYFNYWERPSTKLFMTCNIKPPKPILAQIVTWHSKEVF